LLRISQIGNFNKSSIAIPFFDLIPGKTLVIRSKIVNPYLANTFSDYVIAVVPPIASGKPYCGPCQFADRSKCALLNNICWTDYLNHTVTEPLKTNDCLKLMAKMCYAIWLPANNTSDAQCSDFVNDFNFTLMKMKPVLISAKYSNTGEAIILEFNDAIWKEGFTDCNGLFDDNTNKWLPPEKSCRWSGPKTLVVDYNPEIGIMEEITIRPNTFYYGYRFAQIPADSVKLTIQLPSFEASLIINGISAVSECDTIELFGVVASPTLYPLSFKWDIHYDRNLTGDLKTEADKYFAPFQAFSQISAMQIPSKFISRGLTISITLTAMYAKFTNLVRIANKVVKVYENIPNIRFTSKSDFVLNLIGDKSTRVPLLISNFKCGSNELIPTLTKFIVNYGTNVDNIIQRSTPESIIENSILSDFNTLKQVLVGRSYGFRYLTYYKLTAIVMNAETGASNQDSILLYFKKPKLKSVIDTPGSLVSISNDVILKGENSEFPALESDLKRYTWKCVSASSIAVSGTCQCPILTESDLKIQNLRIPKERIQAMCKYKFSLTINAIAGEYVRSAYNDTEFIAYEGIDSNMKGKVIKGSNNVLKDLYFTFSSQGKLITNNANYKWKLTEAESLDPKVDEKYSETNTFIYEFFKNELKVDSIDPKIKDADVPLSSTTTRRLTDVTPTYLTPTTSQVLGVNKADLRPKFKYTFAVTVYAESAPTFLFISFTMPQKPRSRIFTINPNTGIAFSTQFVFDFTLESSVDIDEAQYQLFRKNCPGESDTITAITQKLTKSNSYTTTLAPGLSKCENKVQIILRVYEFDDFIDIPQNVTVEESTSSAEEIISTQANELENNPALTIDQKISIISQVSEIKSVETTEQNQESVTKFINELSKINATNGMLDNMSDADKIALLETVSSTISNLVISFNSNIELSKASSMTDQVDSYLTAVETKEGGTQIIPSVLAAMSGIADIGITKQADQIFYDGMQKAMTKMTDMKLTEMLPGSVPYSLTSPAIELLISKDFAANFNNTKSFETAKGISVELPQGVSDLLINSMNQSVTGKVTFGASVSTTSYNPYSNIKNNTNISIDSLTSGSTQGFRRETVYRIYLDMSSGKLNNEVDKKEQSTELVNLAVKPFEMSQDASEKSVNSNVSVGKLPPGKLLVFEIPFKKNMSELINSTILVPLFYEKDKKKWTNENCSLDNITQNDKSLKMKCNHMGIGEIKNLNEGFTATVDVLKDALSVIKAGNYEQLVNLSVLLEFSGRSAAIYPIDAVLITLLFVIFYLLTQSDKHELYLARKKCLLSRFEKKDPIIISGCLSRIMSFFIKLRKKGMGKVSKKQQRSVGPSLRAANSLNSKAKKAPLPKSNGFNYLSPRDKEQLEDTYVCYSQCKKIYDDDEVEEIIANEFEKNQILNRLTQEYIANQIVVEPVTFWLLMKNEHPLLNALLMPELTSPRPLKFLVFFAVIIGELFMTGYFFDPELKKPDNFNVAPVLRDSIVFSIAATLLMIPLKIIIGVFMTGTQPNHEMTREQIESSERNAPTLKFIGAILGFVWIIGCIYGTTMYVLTFSDYALQIWMATFGISFFSETVVSSQLKVLFKVIIGLILMKFAKSKMMLTSAGHIAEKIVDWILHFF